MIVFVVINLVYLAQTAPSGRTLWEIL